MAEFTVRITGPSPPPLKPTKSKSKNNTPTQKRYNLVLTPSTLISKFLSDVYALFEISSRNKGKYSIEVRAGFPPKILELDGKKTVAELGIGSETLIVAFSLVESAASGGASANSSASASLAKNTSSAKKTRKTKATQQDQEEESNESEAAASATTSTRKKRAAAEAATSSFAEVIKAQEAMLKQEKKTNKPSTTKHGRITVTDNVHSLMNTSSTSKKKASPKKIHMEGTGYRLSDSQAVSSPSKRQRRSQETFSTQDDVATALISSTSGNKGNISKFLRKAMKGAVMKSYEVSRAQVRVSSVVSGDYTFTKDNNVNIAGGVVLGGGTSNRRMYTVSYGKGIEGRGRYTDQGVEIIEWDVLKSTIETVYNAPSEEDDESHNGREMLRPSVMAQMSPRMFWSLIYHCTQNQIGDAFTSSSSSVENMLRETMPELDWSHLDRGGRKRNLSEKAKENRRQEMGIINTKEEDNSDDGVRVLEELEETIMTGLEEPSGDELRKKRLLALSRLENSNTDTVEWELITPTEEDEDELKECIQEDQNNTNDESSKIYASILMSSESPCCRNWRELANAKPEEVSSKFTIQCSKQKIDPPSLISITNWIDAAQQRSLEEIMLEILDSDQDALELLAEKANSANPWDLSQWHSYPALLADTMGCERYNVEVVGRWISRAKVSLETCNWLEDYSVSVV